MKKVTSFTIAVFSCFKAKKRLKMSSNEDIPVGVWCLKSLCLSFCPRLRLNKLRCYQASILALTYFTYMTYHLTRKPISVVKSVLHRNCSGLTPPSGVIPGDDQWCNWPPFNTPDANTLLGTLDSAFLFSYAAAMFVSGMIAERVDLRYFLSIGMLVSASFCYLLGLAKTLSIHNIWYFIVIQAGAGIAQTTGWPGTVAIVGKWFGDSKKGLIFGIWNSHTSLGNILGTLIAAEYVESNWSLSFMYPALVMGVVGFIVFAFLVSEPGSVGLDIGNRSQSSSRSQRSSSREEDDAQVVVDEQTANLRPNRYSTNASPHCEDASESTALLSHLHGSSGNAISLTRALAIPSVMEFSLSLFFAKLVSYTFLFWLPLYINSSTNLTPKESGDLSTVFDLGGIVGAIAAGLLADKCGAPGLVCVVMYAAAAPTLLLYQMYGASSYTLNLTLLVINGIFVNGPYALITTAVSAELGTHSSLAGNAQALATVTAIIDGTGSIGAAIGPMLAGIVSANGSWSHVFYMLIFCNFMALVLLLRVVRCELLKLRQNRLLTISRTIRIE